MDLTIKVLKKEKEYVASCPELDVFCYGKTAQIARERIKKVIVFYAETATQMGYNIDTSEITSNLDHNYVLQENLLMN